MKINKKKLLKNAKSSKRKQLIEVRIDREKALGAAQRAVYLEENPHGYNKVNHVYKSKKEYSRKKKYKDIYE